MSEPPKLNYETPTPPPKHTKGEKVIGLFGFLAYLGPALLFDGMIVVLGIQIWRFGPGAYVCNAILPLVVLLGMGGFCSWRAIVALMQLIK
jgi:hypothetical protein